jgi:hypothetical protein
MIFLEHYAKESLRLAIEAASIIRANKFIVAVPAHDGQTLPNVSLAEFAILTGARMLDEVSIRIVCLGSTTVIIFFSWSDYAVYTIWPHTTNNWVF